ncbi:MAG: HisA/HisF-related TIM barrel protein, partial [Chloroflexota bacterium]
LTSLRHEYPALSYYAGGGVRGPADLDALARAGAAGALVATAFHHGTLTAADLD